MLLALAIPRRDVKPLAKDLMSLPGVKDATVAALKLVEGAAIRMLKGRVVERPLLAA